MLLLRASTTARRYPLRRYPRACRTSSHARRGRSGVAPAALDYRGGIAAGPHRGADLAAAANGTPPHSAEASTQATTVERRNKSSACGQEGERCGSKGSSGGVRESGALGPRPRRESECIPGYFPDRRAARDASDTWAQGGAGAGAACAVFHRGHGCTAHADGAGACGGLLRGRREQQREDVGLARPHLQPRGDPRRDEARRRGQDSKGGRGAATWQADCSGDPM